MNITIIGAGNMGGAMAEKLLSSNFCTSESLCIVDSSDEKLEKFERLGCPTSTNALDFLPESQIVILATKPQVLRDLLVQWSSSFQKDVLLCSIAAGIDIQSLQKTSLCEKVIRIMPNTPLLVGKGVCGWYGSASVLTIEKEVIQRMLNCFGLSIECQNEDMIDGITALSGSGPAYYFFLLEKMTEQAISFGFTKGEAQAIALHTLMGAGELASVSDDDFETLRKNITSPGGTTQAAIESFEANGLDSVWKKGMQSAYDRAKEL